MVDEQKPFGGQHLETITARIVRMKDVGEAVQSYVDALMPYAGKEITAPSDPATAHQFATVAGKMVLWLVTGKKYTEVQFTLITEDNIIVRVQEPMEKASGDRLQFMKKEIDDFLRDERASRRPIIIH